MLSRSSSLTGQSSAPCWFVGAMINRGDDQTDRFIDEGIWEHDWFAEVVASELKPLLHEYWFDAPDVAEREAERLLEGW